MWVIVGYLGGNNWVIGNKLQVWGMGIKYDTRVGGLVSPMEGPVEVKVRMDENKTDKRGDSQEGTELTSCFELVKNSGSICNREES